MRLESSSALKERINSAFADQIKRNSVPSGSAKGDDEKGETRL